MTIDNSESRLDVFAPPPPRDLPWFQPFDAQGLSRTAQIPLQALWYCALYLNDHYRKAHMPKKSGGTRTLHIPSPQLAWVQGQLLRAFLDKYPWPEHVSAYVVGRNTQAAARVHAGRPVLIVVDIQDFFPSTKRSWVKQAIHDELNIGGQAGELFATLTTCPWDLAQRTNYCVPQGAPTSGAVANLVAVNRLDPLILAVCQKYGMSYTRYADDLAFSRATDLSREETSAFVKEIIGAIRAAKYRVNYDKIRVQRRNRQQRLLGLCINEFPNIPARTYRRARALAHQSGLIGYDAVAPLWGFENGNAVEAYLEGACAYFHGVNPNKAKQLRKYLPCATTRTPT